MIDTDRACGPALSAVRVSTPVRVTFVSQRTRSEVGARGLLVVREKLSVDNGVEPRARAAADANGGRFDGADISCVLVKLCFYIHDSCTPTLEIYTVQ